MTPSFSHPAIPILPLGTDLQFRNGFHGKISVTGLYWCWYCWITTVFSFSSKISQEGLSNQASLRPYHTFLPNLTSHTGTCCLLPLVLALCGLWYTSCGSWPLKDFWCSYYKVKIDPQPSHPWIFREQLMAAYKDDSKAPRGFAKN